MPRSEPTSFRLSPVAHAILEKAETHLGSKRSATVEMALRTWAQTIWPEPRHKPRKKSEKPT